MLVTLSTNGRGAPKQLRPCWTSQQPLGVRQMYVIRPLTHPNFFKLYVILLMLRLMQIPTADLLANILNYLHTAVARQPGEDIQALKQCNAGLEQQSKRFYPHTAVFVQRRIKPNLRIVRTNCKLH